MPPKKNPTPVLQVATAPGLLNTTTPGVNTPEPDDKDAEIETLRAEIRALKGKAAKLPLPVSTDVADITTLNQTSLLGLVQTLIQQRAEPQKKRKARPDPPKLSDGKDPTVEYWTLDMKNKLEADAEDYPTDKDQVGYCITRTEGKAAKHLGPRVGSASKNPLVTADEIFEFLGTVFKDRLTKKKARRQMSELKFRLGSSFHDFITDFRITAQEAEYDDDEWKELLDSALPDNMAQALAVQANDDRVDFEDFVEVCSRYALTAEQRRAKGGRTPYVPAGASPSTSKPSVDPNDQRARRSATPGVRPKYDNAEKQKLSDEGRCFNCGESGHLARACPRPKKENPRATPKEVRFQKDSDEDTLNESGKEGP